MTDKVVGLDGKATDNRKAAFMAMVSDQYDEQANLHIGPPVFFMVTLVAEDGASSLYWDTMPEGKGKSSLYHGVAVAKLLQDISSAVGVEEV